MCPIHVEPYQCYSCIVTDLFLTFAINQSMKCLGIYLPECVAQCERRHWTGDYQGRILCLIRWPYVCVPEDSPLPWYLWETSCPARSFAQRYERPMGTTDFPCLSCNNGICNYENINRFVCAHVVTQLYIELYYTESMICPLLTLSHFLYQLIRNRLDIT